KADSAEDVYKQFLSGRPREKKAYVLWEPYVTMALNEKSAEGAIRLTDSSQYKGYIVDVLVAQDKFLRENPAKVEAVVRAYLEVLHDNLGGAQGMVPMLLEDARIIDEKNVTPERARAIASGIWWKNTMENYGHLELLSSEKAGGLQPVRQMIA